MWVLGIIWCQPAVGPDQGTYRYAAVIVLRQHQTTISKPSRIIVCEGFSQFRILMLGSDGRQTATRNPTRAKMSATTDATAAPGHRTADRAAAEPRRKAGARSKKSQKSKRLKCQASPRCSSRISIGAGRHDVALQERPTSGPSGGRPTGEPTRDYRTGWYPRTRRSKRSA